MNQFEMIRFSLNMSHDVTARLVEDLRGAPLKAPTANGNHPLWIMGHLVFVEASMPSVLLGKPPALMNYAPLFAPGTVPLQDASAYPSFDEVVRTYKDCRAGNLALLEELGPGSLDRKPSNPPPGFEKSMQTFGQTFLLVSMHNMMHAGQLADCRRAAGLKPYM